MVDLEGTAGDGSNGLMSANTNIVTNAKGANYPLRVGMPYGSTNSVYPKIYEEEALRKINGVEINEGIGTSNPANTTADENGFISRGNSKVQLVSSIQPVKTGYYLTYEDFSAALGDNASLLLPNGASTRGYWIASRAINFDSGFCNWVIMSLGNSGKLSGRITCTSEGYYHYNPSYALFPLVVLSSGTLSEPINHISTYTPAQ